MKQLLLTTLILLLCLNANALIVSVDGYGGLGGLDYLFGGLGSLFGDYSYGYYDDYGYSDYSYYDDYDLSFSVGGLGGLFASR